MTETASTPSCCNASPCCNCCCADRLARLEKRVCWMRWILIVVGAFVLLLVGISIGKGGEKTEMRREAIMHMRGGMGPRMTMMRGMPMMRGMQGPDGMRGPDGPRGDDRGPDGPRGGNRGPDGPRDGGRGPGGPDNQR